MKCSNCGKEVEVTFLNKQKGNYYRENGKLLLLCNACFKEKFGNKRKE
ncbi:MAG: hypothetical protein M1284_03440 [Candidatus Parvarchaeota archaeon]|jgi:hypothetical protein|nr:hypothetical protein [Candidatus Parvarchaeota archaeon]